LFFFFSLHFFQVLLYIYWWVLYLLIAYLNKAINFISTHIINTDLTVKKQLQETFNPRF